jgi:hypothetical protein
VPHVSLLFVLKLVTPHGSLLLVQSIHLSAINPVTGPVIIHYSFFHFSPFISFHIITNTFSHSLSCQNRSNTEKRDEHIEVHQELHHPRTLTTFSDSNPAPIQNHHQQFTSQNQQKHQKSHQIENQFANCSSTTNREFKLRIQHQSHKI